MLQEVTGIWIPQKPIGLSKETIKKITAQYLLFNLIYFQKVDTDTVHYISRQFIPV